jgi:hypothetical protein
MKLGLIILFLLVASAARCAGSRNVPAERPRLTEVLRMRVENTSPPPSAIIAASDNGSVMLAPYKVKSTYLPAILKSDDEPEPDSTPFTWQKGGYFFKKAGRTFTREVKFQYSPRNDAFELFRLSW